MIYLVNKACNVKQKIYMIYLVNKAYNVICEVYNE